MPSVWVRQLDITLQPSELSIIPSAAASSFFSPLGLKIHIRGRNQILLNTVGQQNHFSAVLIDKMRKVFWAVFFSILLQRKGKLCFPTYSQRVCFLPIYITFFFETKQKLLCVKNKIVRLQKAQSFHFCWSLHASLRSLQSRELGSTHVGGGGWKWEGVCSMLEESRGA